jgi:two-component system, OmpR family, response regulator
MAKILLVEDNVALATAIENWLEQERFTIEVVHNGSEALDLVRAFPYDLIILDWELPGRMGVDVCTELRELGVQTPILMLTGKSTVKDKRQGLDAGSDDYLTKPFEMEELSARLRALLRRPAVVQNSLMKARNIELDRTSGTVKKDGQEIHLLPKEFALLDLFMRHPNQVFEPNALLARVWPADSEATLQTLRPYINRLRGKIETPGLPPLIRTVHGLGYKLDLD